MNHTDYYKVLGIESNADQNKIKTAYRELAFQFHPDRNKGNPSAAEKMKRVNEAYAVLSNPEKRREYDTLRHQFGSFAHQRFRQSYSEQDIFSGTDIHQVLEELAKSFGFRGYHEIFREFYGKGYKTFEIKHPGFFLGGFILSGHWGKGGQRMGQLPFGGRLFAGLAQQILKKITGVTQAVKGGDVTDILYLDSAFARTGGPYAYENKKRSKKLVIQIPRGVKDGQKIRLAGMGEPGKGGGEAGNLYLKIRVKKPLLERFKKLLS